MRIEQIVEELKQAARRLGLQVRTDTGSFRGGRCTVGADEWIVLNRMHPPEAHLAILAESLRDLPMDTVFLRPAVRAALEAAWRRHDPVDMAEADADG